MFFGAFMASTGVVSYQPILNKLLIFCVATVIDSKLGCSSSLLALCDLIVRTDPFILSRVANNLELPESDEVINYRLLTL